MTSTRRPGTEAKTRNVGQQYKHSPIQEVVCVFQFSPGQAWNITFPGRLYAKFERTYPLQRQTISLETTINQTPESLEHLFNPVEWVQFVRSDETALIQVSPNQLAVHHLNPYPGWPSFKKIIRDALSKYRTVVTPQDVQSIGLRYINRIDLPKSVCLSDYFDYYPHVGRPLPDNYQDFHVGIVVPYDELRNLLRLQLSSVPTEEPETQGLVLDLDYHTREYKNLPLLTVDQWLNEAHQRIEEVFEGSIKDALRDCFEGAA